MLGLLRFPSVPDQPFWGWGRITGASPCRIYVGVGIGHDLREHGLSRALALVAEPEAKAGAAKWVMRWVYRGTTTAFWRRHEVCFTSGWAMCGWRCGRSADRAGGEHRCAWTLLMLSDGRWLSQWLGLRRRFRLAALPLQLCLPWGLVLGTPPGYLPLPAQITIRVLPPIWLSGTTPADADNDEVVARIDAEVRGVMQRALSLIWRGSACCGWASATAARCREPLGSSEYIRSTTQLGNHARGTGDAKRRRKTAAAAQPGQASPLLSARARGPSPDEERALSSREVPRRDCRRSTPRILGCAPIPRCATTS